jgi:ribonuclease D
VWPEKDPAAAARLQTAKPRVAAVAEKLNMPVENLLTPDYLRRLAWRPPKPIDLDSVSAALADLGARRWQIGHVAAVITVAFLDPDPLQPKQAKQEKQSAP